MAKQDTKFLTLYSGDGARWKRNTRKKASKGSQTSGRTKPKNLCCQPTQLDKYMARHNRSYRHPEFANYPKKVREINNAL